MGLINLNNTEVKQLAIGKKIASVSLRTMLSDKSLYTFSPIDSEYKMLADIRDGIDRTLMVWQHRLKAYNNQQAIHIIKNYGKISLLKCCWN
ncbi:MULTISPECIES: hypothetical protein [unclassified Microcoleus]|uniref:hypothetical protein n=1 Tax=unclassified Microcoleus TaxID=2642155 RepID=UPI002FCEBE08